MLVVLCGVGRVVEINRKGARQVTIGQCFIKEDFEWPKKLIIR